MELRKEIIKKVNLEIHDYEEWLMGLTNGEIISRAQECADREYIAGKINALANLKDAELDASRYAKLLESPMMLSDIAEQYRYGIAADCRADFVLALYKYSEACLAGKWEVGELYQGEKTFPVVKCTAKKALERYGRPDVWLASNRINDKCTWDICEAIEKHSNGQDIESPGFEMDAAAVCQEISGKYGEARLKLVLAATTDELVGFWERHGKVAPQADMDWAFSVLGRHYENDLYAVIGPSRCTPDIIHQLIAELEK